MLNIRFATTIQPDTPLPCNTSNTRFSYNSSRRLAISACSLGIDIKVITQEAFNRDLFDEDTLIASLVAKELGIKEHIKLLQPSTEKQREDVIYKDYWCGFESHYHSWAVNITRNLKSDTIIYDGIIGDYTVNNHCLQGKTGYLDGHCSIEKTLSLIAPARKKYHLKSHLTNSSLNDRIRSNLEEFPNDCNQITLFNIFNHCRRNISQWYTSFLLKGINVGLPYGYTPLFLQSLTLDKKYRLDALYQLECMQKINMNAAKIPSTREKHTSDFWRGMGAKKGDMSPDYPVDITASDRVFSFIKQDVQSHINNDLLLRIFPNYFQSKRSWYYEPLKRLNLFLIWLETDEKNLPILYKGTPPFVKNTIKY